jgi:MFS family permease
MNSQLREFLTSFPVLVGAFTDRCSAKKIPFLVGLVVIGASTLMFFFGTSISVLIVARALQGTAAAFVWTAGPTYIMGRVGPEQMGTAMAWITMGSSVGEVTGPVAGGMLYEHSGHFALLDLAIGIVLVDIVLRFAMKESLEAPDLSEQRTPDECTPILLEATPSRKEVLQNRSMLIMLLSNGDLLASLWVGFMTAVIRTALEMVCPPQVNTRCFHSCHPDDPDITSVYIQLV